MIEEREMTLEDKEAMKQALGICTIKLYELDHDHRLMKEFISKLCASNDVGQFGAAEELLAKLKVK